LLSLLNVDNWRAITISRLDYIYIRFKWLLKNGGWDQNI